MTHHRAITEQLPEEMNPVWCGDRSEILSLAGVQEAADVGNDRRITDSEFVQSQSFALVHSRSIATSPSPETPSFFHLPKISAADIPADTHGLAENPEAYRLWQPKKMEQEVMSAQEWQERWSKLREGLSIFK